MSPWSFGLDARPYRAPANCILTAVGSDRASPAWTISKTHGRAWSVYCPAEMTRAMNPNSRFCVSIPRHRRNTRGCPVLLITLKTSRSAPDARANRKAPSISPSDTRCSISRLRLGSRPVPARAAPYGTDLVPCPGTVPSSLALRARLNFRSGAGWGDSCAWFRS